ncbi:hypothetical protein BDR26DRAFT_862272 [Obelidium mucronatum]|nr:hypothetical protein BDR26DRAFT_862272 [Obelidium mucronatum]
MNDLSLHQLQKVMAQLSSLEGLRQQAQEIYQALSFANSLSVFLSLELTMQAIVIVVTLLLVRLLVGFVRSTVRTVVWTLKMAVLVLCAAVAVKYFYAA